MGVDPCADVGLIGTREHLRSILPAREMEPEPGGGRDADLAARNMAKQDSACRLTGTDNADVDTAGCETSPARIVLHDAAAVIVIYVNRLCQSRGSKAARECSQKRSEDGHSEDAHSEDGLSEDGHSADGHSADGHSVDGHGAPESCGV
jgi:hypothetical protein